MSVERSQLLLKRANAQAASNREDLPPEIRQAYKAAADQADLVLGLQDAKARKTARPAPPQLSGEPTDSDQPIPTGPQLTPQLSKALPSS